MVQEPRLALSRALAAGLGLLLAVAPGPVDAQALLSEPPLNSLLKPRDLYTPKPLLPQAAAAGSPCARATPTGKSADAPTGDGPGRPGAPPARTPAGAASGGSGPGSYAQYMPGAATAAAAAAGGSAATPARAGDPVPTGANGVDRPLYAGVDRPLWGEPPTVPHAVPAPGSKAGGPERTAVPATTGLPRDRPLWAEAPSRPLSAAGPPSAGNAAEESAAAGPGFSLVPCRAGVSPPAR